MPTTTSKRRKPVHGSPAIDERGESLYQELDYWYSEQYRQNLSFDLAKRLSKRIGLLDALMRDTTITLLTKKGGGVRGAARAAANKVRKT